VHPNPFAIPIHIPDGAHRHRRHIPRVLLRRSCQDSKVRLGKRLRMRALLCLDPHLPMGTRLECHAGADGTARNEWVSVGPDKTCMTLAFDTRGHCQTRCVMETRGLSRAIRDRVSFYLGIVIRGPGGVDPAAGTWCESVRYRVGISTCSLYSTMNSSETGYSGTNDIMEPHKLETNPSNWLPY